MLTTALGWISRIFLIIASCLAMGLAFVVVADVVGRVVFSAPLRGTPEIVASSVVIVCFFQATYAILSGGMMRVDLVVDRFPQRMQSLTGIATSLLGIGLFFIIFWGSIDGFSDAWTYGEYEGEGALRVPVWPVRLSVLLGSGLAMIAYVLHTLRYASAFLSGGPVPAPAIIE